MNTLDARRRLLGRNVYKKTVEGNPAIAQGSLARRDPGIAMQGWTEQTQYEGNQLFNAAAVVEGILSDGNLAENSQYFTSDFIPIVSGNVYSRTITGAAGNFFYDSDKTYLQNIGGIANVEAPDGASYVRFSISKNEVNVQDIMFNEGSTVLPYEPYTGGQPSPSPDYKQDVKNAGKYDEETQKYEHGIELAGKNLTDIPDITADMKQTDIPCYIVSQIIISMVDDDVQTTSNIWRIRVTTKDGTMNYLMDGTLAKTFQATPENPIIQITYRGINITAGAYKNIQVEYGDVATEYEPYKTPQTVTLTSDRPLTKWDKLEKRNGQWGWVYKSAEIVLDGSEDEAISLYAVSEIQGSSFAVYIPDSVGGYQTSLCDKYRNINNAWGAGYKGKYDIYSDHMTVTIKSRYFRPPSAEVQTVEQWRTWLSENPLTLWYETAEETFVPLSAAEQEQMNALHTFRPTTVLSNDCDCNMILTYKTKKSLEVTD